MDRKLVYPSQVPLSADFLQVQRNSMLALAYDIQAWGGTGTIADGLGCIPSVPASLAVQILPGSLCQLAANDQTAFGSLAVDVTHQIMQQGILLDATSLTLTPPGTAGQAINYLIQAQFQASDTDATVLAYFNSANPTVPFMGPANSGTAQPTTRKGIIVLQAKAGVAATAGTQVTPSPDAGYVGLYSVTVANGATALTSGQISQLATAPFLSVKLPQVPLWVQNGAYANGVDGGTANAMSVTLSPVPAAYPYSIYVKKIASANTGAMTVAFPGTGLGTVSIINADGSPLTTGQMAAIFMAHLVFDGTSYRFMNGVASTGVGSITGTSGEGITVGGTTPFPVSMNVPGLTTNNSPGNTDLFPYYNQTDVHHRGISYAALIAALAASLPTSLLRVTSFNASGTWTKGANTRRIWVFATGAGGGGGGDPTSVIRLAGFGGAAGWTALAIRDATALTTVAVTIGPGGAASSTGDGSDGGQTSFGTIAVAPGGQGGVGSPSYGSGMNRVAPTGVAGTPVGDVVLRGGPGNGPPSTTTTTGNNWGGNGGNSFWGGSGAGAINEGSGTTIAAQDGMMGGGGGGGDHGGVNGPSGKGGDGFVLVLEFS